MSGQAAGAPLRTMATLAAIWILVRIISWINPANNSVDPVIPDKGKAAFHNSAQIFQGEKQRLSGVPIAAPVGPEDIADIEHDSTNMSYPARRAIYPTAVDLPAAPRRFWLPLRQPELVAYRLLPAAEPKRAGSFSQGIECDTLSLQNRAARQRGKGFSGYFWAFARQTPKVISSVRREGGAIISNGQYGGSQIGAILSYPISAKPELAVYGRLTAALAPLAQEEIAFGVRVHPVQSLPVSVHVEQRFDADSGGDRGAAFYAAGGTGPDPIVERVTLETYAQAGYVFGNDETHFFDGSAILQHPVAESDRKELSLGAGVWAGGQRRVTRLDIGPRADFRIPLGTRSARIAVDWRVRVAGNARPGSGLAVTVATGF